MGWGIPLPRWPPLSKMNPALWPLAALAPVIYEVWKDTRTVRAAQPRDFQVQRRPM